MTSLRDKLRKSETPRATGRSAANHQATARGPVFDINRKLLLAAAAIAVLAALIAVGYLSDLSKGIAGQGAKITVWMTRSTLPARQQITESAVELREVPKYLLPEGYLGQSAKVVGKITLAPLSKGEILLGLRIADPGAVTGITPKLRPNERGFVLLPAGVEDLPLIKPDDTIDLIATLPEPGSQRLIATTVLEEARVLAVGGRFWDEATDSTATSGGAITLAVPAKTINLLAILKQSGNLHFALRAPGDTQRTTSKISEADIERLVMGQLPRPVVRQTAQPRPIIRTRIVYERPKLQAKPQPVVPRPVAPKPQPQPPQVEIYSGAQKQN
ncbi:MAG: Flp pilus assembly protein CpaB [Cyanobacteria bacterium NC_groundwater_1444_Ag_S-0.65um_54_12]|nr:Flp pilus assembly protein CpaB [Cyanobacteria bacterium NC_groundwater_1444_Ag_S-0.65um_54_12]